MIGRASRYFAGQARVHVPSAAVVEVVASSRMGHRSNGCHLMFLAKSASLPCRYIVGSVAMRISNRFVFALLSIACVGKAFCQEQHPVEWHFSAGYSGTSGVTKDYLDPGWILGGGLLWHPQPGGPFAVGVDLNYSWYDVTDALIDLAVGQVGPDVRIDDGDAAIWSLNVNGRYSIPFSSNVHGYLTAGIGGYHRKVQMTQTALFSGVICDPWWGYCYQDIVQGDRIVADRSTTRFGWNGGVGVEFFLHGGGSIFIDARYHQMETEKSTVFIPIQIGLRY
jgi:opacity protein-like surface antigen